MNTQIPTPTKGFATKIWILFILVFYIVPLGLLFNDHPVTIWLTVGASLYLGFACFHPHFLGSFWREGKSIKWRQRALLLPIPTMGTISPTLIRIRNQSVTARGPWLYQTVLLDHEQEFFVCGEFFSQKNAQVFGKNLAEEFNIPIEDTSRTDRLGSVLNVFKLILEATPGIILWWVFLK